MDDEPSQAPCWAGQQAVGTMMGTMFGFVSAALLAPTKGEQVGWVPAAPGVVLGSALGVVAVNFSGEGKQPGIVCAMLAVGAVAIATILLCSVPVVREVSIKCGAAGVMMLAGVASLVGTMVFAVRDHYVWIVGGTMDRRGALPTKRNVELIDHKQV